MADQDRLKKLYARLGHLRGLIGNFNQPGNEGRKSVYEAEIKDISKRIDELKGATQ